MVGVVKELADCLSREKLCHLCFSKPIPKLPRSSLSEVQDQVEWVV